MARLPITQTLHSMPLAGAVVLVTPERPVQAI